jgi:hypothetical protein
MRIEIDQDDLDYGEQRPITTDKERFQWVEQTYSLLGKEGFYEESLYSCALESWTTKRLGIPRKSTDDTAPDFYGVEVTSRAAHYWADGRPYLCSRIVSQNPHVIRFYPTLTALRVPTRDRVMDLRYFVEPEVVTLENGTQEVQMNGRRLHLRQAYTRKSGITRWQVDLVASAESRSDVDVWARFEHAVQLGQQQQVVDQEWVQRRKLARRRGWAIPPRPLLTHQALMVVPAPEEQIADVAATLAAITGPVVMPAVVESSTTNSGPTANSLTAQIMGHNGMPTPTPTS